MYSIPDVSVFLGCVDMRHFRGLDDILKAATGSSACTFLFNHLLMFAPLFMTDYTNSGWCTCSVFFVMGCTDHETECLLADVFLPERGRVDML